MAAAYMAVLAAASVSASSRSLNSNLDLWLIKQPWRMQMKLIYDSDPKERRPRADPTWRATSCGFIWQLDWLNGLCLAVWYRADISLSSRCPRRSPLLVWVVSLLILRWLGVNLLTFAAMLLLWRSLSISLSLSPSRCDPFPAAAAAASTAAAANQFECHK